MSCSDDFLITYLTEACALSHANTYPLKWNNQPFNKISPLNANGDTASSSTWGYPEADIYISVFLLKVVFKDVLNSTFNKNHL